ncbi:tRNA delta(2)-isopentenylpyrophosphate transferase [Pelagerythrobacter marensis]|uniref:tRNA dimethylallyltransferase n=1 Tax=Pelagerythrobacter marensis TaxID=543877 RepID=A0A0G3X8D9_9SPHN|nr:tRNA delta(2)-isopentenylpyrophosphate transferase [Pelagerythrobacter marensis]
MRLAQSLIARGQEACVINADSAQVYRDLHVLSARPSAEETGGVPHRLFGTWDGAQACSAADWAAAAKAEIAMVHARGGVPVLVGGTGLYLRTLIDGIAPVPPIDPDVRAAVRAKAVGETYEALENLDPERAAQLSPNDTTRVARALEVALSTGKPLAHWQANREGGIADRVSLHPLILLPDRQWLYERCDRRFAAMLGSGAVAEVEALLGRRLNPELPVMRAIGVREIAAWLAGEMTREEAMSAGQLATRQYAKRQYTWFRRQPPQDWHRTESYSDDLPRMFASLLPE